MSNKDVAVEAVRYYVTKSLSDLMEHLQAQDAFHVNPKLGDTQIYIVQGLHNSLPSSTPDFK